MPLLTHKKGYIRSFTAGCMAFVLRKVPTSKLLHLLMQLNQEEANVTFNTSGVLLAEVLRSPDGNFHSISTEASLYWVYMLFRLFLLSLQPLSEWILKNVINRRNFQ